MSFTSALTNTLSNAVQLTENGAVGYVTTGKNIVDMFFKISSYRNMPESAIKADFAKVYAENPNLAVKFAFYVGDIREGLGERRAFKAMIEWLSAVENFNKLIKYIPEYNRFDSMFVLRGTALENQMVKAIKLQLVSDKNDEHPSLLAKWMPSINTSSPKTKELGRWFASQLGMTERQYRKTLSGIRQKLELVESKMCANEWNSVNYEHVPSKANLIYKDAFLKHDETRRREFLEKVLKGEAKINSGVNFPHDVVHKYGRCPMRKDDAIEALWANLKNTLNDASSNIMVVRDGSGSMTSTISGTSISALEVATALAVYFSERQTGEFKNKFITFSSRPEFVDLSNCKTLQEKLRACHPYDECSNTDIEATFDLVLKTAVQNNLKQEEIPTLLIVSDMEFDHATTMSWNAHESEFVTLFKTIETKFKAHGYELPKLIFWNVMSRTGTIPMKENAAGVGLVSGFSTNVIKAVLSNELDPYQAIVKILDSERYASIKL